jgi:hypothetical protein
MSKMGFLHGDPNDILHAMLRTIFKSTVIGLRLVAGIEGEDGEKAMVSVLRKLKKYSELSGFAYLVQKIFVDKDKNYHFRTLKMQGNGCRKMMSKWKYIFVDSVSDLFDDSPPSLKLRFIILSYRFSLLCEILKYFRRDYLRKEDGEEEEEGSEERKKEKFEKDMKRMEKVCVDFYVICTLTKKHCQYDIYILEYPKLARFLYENGLTLDCLSTEVFEQKNKWIKFTILRHTFYKGFQVWQAIVRRNDEQLFVDIHYPLYRRLRNLRKKSEEESEGKCRKCNSKLDEKQECVWHNEMEDCLRESIDKGGLVKELREIFTGPIEQNTILSQQCSGGKEENEDDDDDGDVSDDDECESGGFQAFAQFFLAGSEGTMSEVADESENASEGQDEDDDEVSEEEKVEENFAAVQSGRPKRRCTDLRK